MIRIYMFKLYHKIKLTNIKIIVKLSNYFYIIAKIDCEYLVLDFLLFYPYIISVLVGASPVSAKGFPKLKASTTKILRDAGYFCFIHLQYCPYIIFALYYS
jgi:hypothetical protein